LLETKTLTILSGLLLSSTFL